MLENLLSAETDSPMLRESMLHYFEIITAISSILLIRKGDEEALTKKDALWKAIRQCDPELHRVMTHRLLGFLVNLSIPFSRNILNVVYTMAQRIFGFN
jgi:hypothetical protein